MRYVTIRQPGFRIPLVVRLIILAAALFLRVAPAAAEEPKQFDLPAQAAETALRAAAIQGDFEILIPPKLVAGKKTNEVHGSYLPSVALAKLLQGTGLTVRALNSRGFVVEEAKAGNGSSPASSGGASNGEPTVQAQLPAHSQSQGVSASEPTTPNAVKDETKEQSPEGKPAQLEGVVVTGSRIRVAARDRAQPVKIYFSDDIESSGQSTVAEFLSTLPNVSISSTENPTQTANAASTVRLHGLQDGTLVLLDGRRLNSSPPNNFFNFFDLNSIPVSMVERIEVVPTGSSAIYGSDAMAGVVNIILRRDFTGVQADAKYGGASGTNEVGASLAGGLKWDRGAISVIGTFQTRSELVGSERSLTSSDDFTRFGGPDNRALGCNPGNVFSVDGSNLPSLNSSFAAVPTGLSGTAKLSDFQATSGTLNLCSTSNPYATLIPETHRYGVLVNGHYDVNSNVQLFTETLYSRVEQITALGGPPSIFDSPGFTPLTVAASNPFNPFGTTVGVSYLFTSLGRMMNDYYSDFFRPLVGARGRFNDDWEWEVSGWEAQTKTTTHNTNTLNVAATQAALNSTDPNTALNVFSDGPAGSSSLIQSLVYDQIAHTTGRTASASALLRGSFGGLPSGLVHVAVGAEYDHITANAQNYLGDLPSGSRDVRAVYGEARVPLLANDDNPKNGDKLVASLSARYDSYSDFGSKTTPQFGIEWRPLSGLLLRGAYAKAFVAPTLFQLYQPSSTYFQTVVDTMRGNEVVTVPGVSLGNPNLKPETGQSRSFGLIYIPPAIPDLRVTVTNWGIDETNHIQSPFAPVAIANPDAFPGAVTREPNCAGGPPCPITLITSTFFNYGTIAIAGMDYELNYEVTTPMGEFSPAIAVTQTYHYEVALNPNVLPTNRVSQANDDGNWAPRWKGTVALGWKLHSLSATLDGRYVSRYTDYDSTNQIGNFWLFDGNVRYNIGSAVAGVVPHSKDAYIEIGGVNLFNRLPQYSNFAFGSLGYDPAQGDIRGRFLYLRLGAKW